MAKKHCATWLLGTMLHVGQYKRWSSKKLSSGVEDDIEVPKTI